MKYYVVPVTWGRPLFTGNEFFAGPAVPFLQVSDVHLYTDPAGKLIGELADGVSEVDLDITNYVQVPVDRILLHHAFYGDQAWFRAENVDDSAAYEGSFDCSRFN